MGYDPNSRVLEIEYANSCVYDYYDVPPGVYQELCEADSLGAFVNFRIKPNFPAQEIIERNERTA